MDYWQSAISLVTGGLAGALVNLYFTQRRQRVEIALELIDYFFSNYREIGEVKRILQNPTSLTNIEENRVRMLGDWLNLVATLCQRKVVDKRLLNDVVVFSEMLIFRNLVQGSINQSNVFNDAWKWWPDLYNFTQSLKA